MGDAETDDVPIGMKGVQPQGQFTCFYSLLSLAHKGSIEVPLRGSLTDAGFGHITIQRLTCQLHFRDDREAVVAALDGGAVALAVARFDPETYAAAAAEYLASLAPCRNGEGYDVPGEFVVAVGYRNG